MSTDELRAEIEALRREIAGLRGASASSGQSESVEAEDAAEAGSAAFTDQLHALAREIAAFAEGTEKGVVDHPLASVLGALVLGVLIGRVLHR
jgi:ElaB/YqjD/DUF883 family membrane-anchored ribosome-binding protein